MKEFDYIIVGGGCAGLSLAYELEINKKLKDKTLAIIEKRAEYKKDKVKISEENILSKIKDREEAKKAGNYKLADQIRDDLNKEGIDIKDEKGKTTWSYK